MTLITGKCLSFDGNDNVIVTDDASLDISGDITIELWFKATSVDKFHTLISKGADHAYNFRIRDSNKIQFYIVQADTNLKEVTTDATIVVSTWYHLVAVGTAGGTLQIYINGALSKTGDTYTDIETNATDLYIGQRSDGWVSGFTDGLIDEIRIYNRASGLTEIQYNYNSGDGRADPYDRTGLVLWLPMLEGGGVITYDKSVEINNGNINGATWVEGKIKHTGGIWDFATWG